MMYPTLGRAASLACVGLAVWSRMSHAQPAAPDAPASTGPTFVQPTVSDPMLAPPEAAPAEIRSWDEAITLMRHSPDYLTSVAGVERAVAQRRIALAAVLPTLVGSGSYLHNFNTESIPFGTSVLVEPPATVWSMSATASWNAINPRGIYGIGTADLATEVANLTLDDRRRLLAEAVVSAMLATLAAERVAELDRVGLRAALERLTLTETRIKFSRGTALDVDRAQQDVEAARALLIAGDEALRRSRESLGGVLGSPTPLAAPPTLELGGFERAVASTCHVNAKIEQRADIVAARQRVAIADRQITDANLMFAPILGIGSQAAEASAVTLGPTDTWTIGAALTLPLYDGGVRYAAARDARAAAEQARQALAQMRVDAMIDAARAAREVGVDTAARDVAKEQRDLAARIDGRTREGYASGLGTSLDLVTSAQALRQAEINLVLLDFQLAQSRARAVLVNAECLY